MSYFAEEIRGRLLYVGLLDEASFTPPMPSYKLPAGKLQAVAHLLQLDGTRMLRMSQAIARGDIQRARSDLRRVYHRMDSALRQIDRLEREAKRAAR